MVESDFGCSSASLISMSIYLMPCFDNLAFCAVICAEVALVAKLMPHSPFKACPGLFSKFCWYKGHWHNGKVCYMKVSFKFLNKKANGKIRFTRGRDTEWIYVRVGCFHLIVTCMVFSLLKIYIFWWDGFFDSSHVLFSNNVVFLPAQTCKWD